MTAYSLPIQSPGSFKRPASILLLTLALERRRSINLAASLLATKPSRVSIVFTVAYRVMVVRQAVEAVGFPGCLLLLVPCPETRSVRESSPPVFCAVPRGSPIQCDDIDACRTLTLPYNLDDSNRSPPIRGQVRNRLRNRHSRALPCAPWVMSATTNRDFLISLMMSSSIRFAFFFSSIRTGMKPAS